jgi:hypothetical protein
MTRREEKMKQFRMVVTVAGLVLAVIACASTPTWKGMSESDIASWQQLGINAEGAHEFQKAGLTPKDVEGWYAAGVKTSEQILEWHGKGFGSSEAAEWIQQQFSSKDAVSWKKENFTAAQAGKWKAGGFDLDDAIENREKGLQPIK